MTHIPAHVSAPVVAAINGEQIFQNGPAPLYTGDLGNFIYFVRGQVNRLYAQTNADNSTNINNRNTINKLDILREITGTVLRYFEVYGGNSVADLAELGTQTDVTIRDLNSFIINVDNNLRDAEDYFVLGNNANAIVSLKWIYTLSVEAKQQHGAIQRRTP